MVSNIDVPAAYEVLQTPSAPGVDSRSGGVDALAQVAVRPDARPSSSPRDHSLDALRGLTVVGMAIVNLQGAGAKAFPLLEHAEWNGLTFADLIFPLFLLAGGVAVPLALDSGKSRSVARLARRAGFLVAIGLVFNILFMLALALPGLRVSGVLQRIGIVYFACGIVALRSRGPRTPLVLAALLLAAHGLTLLFVAAPGEAHPSLEAGRGISAWLDRTLLPGRVRHGFDPEGVLSTLSSIAEGLVGVGVMRAVARAKDPRRALTVIAGAGVAVLVAGVAVSGLLPLNKRLWTPNFALVTSGVGLLAWAALRVTWPKARPGPIAREVGFLGRTALTFYALHMLLMVLLVIKIGGVKTWDRMFGLLAGVMPGAWASLAFALIWSAVCIALMHPLARRGWLLRI